MKKTNRFLVIATVCLGLAGGIFTNLTAAQAAPMASHLSGDQAMSAEMIRAIKNNPGIILDKFPEGGPIMVEFIARAVGSDISVLKPILSLIDGSYTIRKKADFKMDGMDAFTEFQVVPTSYDGSLNKRNALPGLKVAQAIKKANEPQKKAIGAGLAVAAQGYEDAGSPEAAGRIAKAAMGTGDAVVIDAFSEASEGGAPAATAGAGIGLGVQATGPVGASAAGADAGGAGGDAGAASVATLNYLNAGIFGSATGGGGGQSASP